MMRLAVLLVVITGCGNRSPDVCERAMARLARIEQPGAVQATAETNREILAACRRGTDDPVMRCALDAAADEAAASCIRAFLDAVVTPGSGGSDGLNPLLEPKR